MTDPAQFGAGGDNDPPRQWNYPPPYPAPGQYPGSYLDPAAPYGRDPGTGEPMSDKSKVIAGLLQLIGLFGLLGFGRMYIGQVGLGVAQLLIGLVVTAVTCGYGVAVPVIWAIIDAILMFAGNVRDSNGRPLRNG